MRLSPPTLLLLLAPLLGGPVAARDDSAESTVRPARTHVLHLTDGRVLRVKARAPLAAPETDSAVGSWEIRQGSGREARWVEIPGERIARASLESDLLKQARSLERKVKRNDLVGRAAYADWLANEGLHVEALGQLDRILGADPDEPNACAIIGRANFPVALPRIDAGADERTLRSFFVAASSAKPAVREIAVQRLRSAAIVADDEGATEEALAGLESRLLGELVDRSARRRAFATLALRRVLAGRHVKPLLSRAILDSCEDVRVGAALALRDAENPALILPALRALGSEHAKVRKNAAQALGSMNYAAAAAPLYSHLVNLQSGSRASGAPRSNIYVGSQRAYVQDYDVEVSQFSAIADPVINVLSEGNVLDVAVVGVHDYSMQTERATVRRSLARLTGASPGNTTAAWKRWWEENGEGWLAANVPQDPSSPISRGH